MATVQTRIKALMWEGKPFSIFFRYGNVESLVPALPASTISAYGFELGGSGSTHRRPATTSPG
jgi:hypothetical protein